MEEKRFMLGRDFISLMQELFDIQGGVIRSVRIHASCDCVTTVDVEYLAKEKGTATVEATAQRGQYLVTVTPLQGDKK